MKAILERANELLSKLTGKRPKQANVSFNAVCKFIECFVKEGGNELDLKEAVNSPNREKIKEIVNLLRNGLYELSPGHKAAKEIMGDNFFGIEENIKYLKIRPTRKQLAELANIPYSPETLQECKHSHMLVAIFPMSLMQMLFNELFGAIFDRENLGKLKQSFKDQMFALDPGNAVWLLLRKSPEKGSTDKEWIKELEILGDKNRVASVRVVIYGMAAYFLKTGERLFNGDYMHLRCLEVEKTSRRRITVIPFRNNEERKDAREVRIEPWWDSGKCYFIGLATTRVPDLP